MEEARRFILYNKVAIETAPLQVYVSALVFWPTDSKIKRHYKEGPDNPTLYPRMVGATWSQLIQELPFNYHSMCMAFSPDGRWLATGSPEGTMESGISRSTVEIWDVLASHRIQSFRVDDFMVQVGFSPEGHKLVVVLSSGRVQHLEVDSGRCVGSFVHNADVLHAVFSRECQFVALTLHDSTTTILRFATAESIQVIADVLMLGFSPDSLHLAARLTKDRVAMWRVGSDKPVWTVEVAAGYVAFFGNDQIAVRCDDDTIVIRTVRDGSLIRTFPCHPQIGTMTWLGTGLSFLSWTYDGKIQVCDDTGTSCGQKVFIKKNQSELKKFRLLRRDGVCYTLSTSSHLVAWAGGSTIKIWDLTRRTSPTVVDDIPKTRRNPVFEITFSPNTANAPLFATSSKDVIKIWNVQGGNVICAHTFPMPYLRDLVFSPDARRLVCHTWDGHVYVWATADGALSVEQFSGLSGTPSFSPDGRRLALTLGEEGVCLWDFAAQCVIDTIPQFAQKVAFSPDGNTLAIAGYSFKPRRAHIEVWAVSQLHRLHTLDFEKEILKGEFEFILTSIAFSTDSKSLIVATDTAIYIWPLGAPEPRCRLDWTREKFSRSEFLAMSPDDRVLALAVSDTVWIWHLEHTTASPLRVGIPHKTKTCRFDADNTQLWVDGGVVDLSELTVVANNTTIGGSVSDSHSTRDRYARYQTMSAGPWLEARGSVFFRGYTLSRDRVWVMKDNQRLLYLPPEYRPEEHPKIYPGEEVAFMGSTVAIGAEDGQVHVLRFQDHLTAGDSRWE